MLSSAVVLMRCWRGRRAGGVCWCPTLSLQLAAWWRAGVPSCVWAEQFHPAGEECEEYEETSSPEGSSWSSVWTQLNIVSQTARTVGPQLDHSWSTVGLRSRQSWEKYFSIFLFTVWKFVGVVTTVTFRGLVDGNISPILDNSCSVIRQW